MKQITQSKSCPTCSLFERRLTLSTGWIPIQPIQRTALLTLIHWIVIYAMNSIVQPSNNRGRVKNIVNLFSLRIWSTLQLNSFNDVSFREVEIERLPRGANEKFQTSLFRYNWILGFKVLEAPGRTRFKAGSVALGVHKHGWVKYCCTLVLLSKLT